MGTNATSNGSSVQLWLRALTLIALALATVAAYSSLWSADWILFDDPAYVIKNPHIARGFTSEGIHWILTSFRTGHGGNYHPLTSFAHMLDAQLFGFDARGPHLVNLALHVANSLLVCVVLARFTGAWWRSAFVAALFALHPLHVESVAWISERKDVLSTLFFLLVLDAYRRWTLRPARGKYAVVCVWFALGLLSKPMLVTLPCVLLLLDFWPLARFDSAAPLRSFGRLLFEKAPLFALSLAGSIATFVVQHGAGAVMGSEALPANERVLNALASYARYLGKMFVPRDLAVFYPHDRSTNLVLPLLGLAVVAGVTLLAWLERKRLPWLGVGWLWFVGTLVPVIGLVQVGGQALADRYMYIPSIGLFIVIVWAAATWLARTRAWMFATAGLGIVLIAACGVVTAQQVLRWHDSLSLFAYTLSVTHDNATANQVYANALIATNQGDLAIPYLEEALRIRPDSSDAHNNLGSLLGSKRQFDQAIAHFRAALRTENTAEVHHNLGMVLEETGHTDEAVREYQATLAIDPDHVLANVKLGITLSKQGKFDEAAPYLERALAFAPDELEARRRLGFIRYRQGRYEMAATHLERSLARVPEDPQAWLWLAESRIRLGLVEDAIRAYREILKRDPKNLDALNNIAWIRATHADATHRDGAEAVRLAEEARAASAEESDVLLSTLAAAYGEVGRFDEAVTVCGRALDLAKAASEAREAQALEDQLACYRAKRPFHLPP